MSEKSVLFGHRIVAIVIAFVLLVSATSIVLPLFTGNPIKFTSLIRFALTLGLCWQLYHGKKWARVVSILLMTIAGLQTVVAGVVLMSYGSLALMIIAFGVVYLGAAVAISLPPQVRHYFAYVS
ncbi:hypothetical protein E7T06_13065 [Deinococcus sp. Arct2-2]|uniref:hypothetical protein n=1 Tax=Deinococcus sp. Arct2-2 TaxID=2568653 RepID=UPI0010A50135|nr:hypothetical protein [Deinococcus sp. Arct2-2]THF69200.1 hypothetical protein E7T06_13065 [Deinococcus sp. Arct2-2]